MMRRTNVVFGVFIILVAVLGLLRVGYSIGVRDGTRDAKQWKAVAEKSQATSKFALSVMDKTQATADDAQATAKRAIAASQTWEEVTRKAIVAAGDSQRVAARWERIANGFRLTAEGCVEGRSK